ncbi:hypothetical protein LCGC14_1470670 [marine sediment metagenome]|uniref:10 kDa chaperonin n=1 Tax=marine sediment metagenome TaxID=412755 RepID=A0A0F9JCF5_9ZZZZ
MSECSCDCGLQPVSDKLIIRKLDEDEKTEGGLFMPEDTTEKSVIRGKVIAAGPGQINQFISGAERLPMPAKTGDIVLFAGYQGQKIDYCGEELHVLSANDILCVETKKEN